MVFVAVPRAAVLPPSSPYDLYNAPSLRSAVLAMALFLLSTPELGVDILFKGVAVSPGAAAPTAALTVPLLTLPALRVPITGGELAWPSVLGPRGGQAGMFMIDSLDRYVVQRGRPFDVKAKGPVEHRIASRHARRWL